MRIGIFADIHGNQYAFEIIYRKLRDEACDLHLFLGDVCGYYYRQNEIIEILREMPNLQAVAGNHDAEFLEALGDDRRLEYFCEKYGRSFELLKETITSANLEFLMNLPEELSLPSYGIAAYHGSPWAPMHEYIYPDSPLDRFAELPFEIVFLAHTHYPMDRKHSALRVINPGSAGQPRDGGWPSYAIYDAERKNVEIKHVPYDVSALIHDVEEMKEEKTYLLEVLRRIKR